MLSGRLAGEDQENAALQSTDAWYCVLQLVEAMDLWSRAPSVFPPSYEQRSERTVVSDHRNKSQLDHTFLLEVERSPAACSDALRKAWRDGDMVAFRL